MILINWVRYGSYGNKYKAMAKKTRITTIAELLNTVFHGGAWHGPSLMELAEKLKVKEAEFKAGNIHTIAELLYHITSWRIFALKKIAGDAKYNIETEKQNFGDLRNIDELELEGLMMELTLTQAELENVLKEKEDGFLDEIVPGAEYTFETLFHGIIHHDIYHSGQIAIIKKLVAKSAAYDDEDAYGDSPFFDPDGDDYY